ncbi:MAG: iduronate-2-sulfatase [Pirellulaceae bacterium]|nr:MAG: iduronate-2-sulfatase [Pirellulaceae bacterium]
MCHCFAKSCWWLILCVWMVATVPVNADEPVPKPNVLFIAIDDLNHWVGHLGRHPQARTPNLDRLASQGVSFSRAYCAAPACNPSRAALMSGRRPSSTGCYLNSQDWRPAIPETQLLNSHFARAGYVVWGAGKIYHGPQDRGGHWDDYFAGHGGRLVRHPEAPDDGVGGIKFYPLANPDEEMPDYQVVDFGIQKLREKHDRPFFLAIGLYKPHMPFAVPKKWFDMFPLDSIELPPYREDDLEDVPSAGRRMARPEGDHRAILSSGRWREAVRAYLATIAFADAQVGRLLDALDQSQYRDNTIVVLWSDHGWSLGEKSHWRKFALWEEPTRSVLIWRVPGLTAAGQQCHRTVDFLCVYPTLCELAGLDRPEHLEGRSIVSLLKDPQAPWELPAITTYGRGNHTVRTEAWRYIRYANGDEELYNEMADPFEYQNLAGRSDYAAIKQELARWLPAHDAPDLPPRGSQ